MIPIVNNPEQEKFRNRERILKDTPLRERGEAQMERIMV